MTLRTSIQSTLVHHGHGARIDYVFIGEAGEVVFVVVINVMAIGVKYCTRVERRLDWAFPPALINIVFSTNGNWL